MYLNMKFTPVYSAKYGKEYIRNTFFDAKYPRKKCDFCNSSNVYFVDENKTRLRCKDCWKRSSITHNTYLESTKLSLKFWYEVIWSFVLDHPSSKTRKLLKANNHQTILRVYRTIRKALLDRHEDRYPKLTDRSRSSRGIGNDGLRRFKELHGGESGDTLEGFPANNDGANHPIYAVYKTGDKLSLWLFSDIVGPDGNGKHTIGPDSSGMDRDDLVGFGCLFHGKGEYVNEQESTHLEGLWNFTKYHMGIYQGIRKENWIYYLKEVEFKYNSRNDTYDKQVNDIIKLLMSQKRTVSNREEDT